MDVEVTTRGTSCRLNVRVSPGGRRNAIIGPHGGALKVVVTAPPEKGKANKAVLRLLARSLGIPSGHLELVSGASSRDKVVEIQGVDSKELLGKLHQLVRREASA